MRTLFFVVGILAGIQIVAGVAFGADQAAELQSLQKQVVNQAREIAALESLGVSTTLPFRGMVGLYELHELKKSVWLLNRN